MVTERKIGTVFQEKGLFIVYLLLFFLFAFAVLSPLFCVITRPTIADFSKVIFSPGFKRIAFNTIFLGFLTSVFSTLLGYLYAYGVEYTKLRFKKFFLLLPLVHIVLPSSINSLSFILLLGKNGFLTSALLHLNVSLYGISGVVIAQCTTFFPLAYIICLIRLKGINHLLENAAQSCRRNNFQIFLLTSRLSLGSIIQSFLFIFVLAMSDFGTPIILGGRLRVIAGEIYTLLTGWVDVSKSAVYATFLFIPSIVFFIALKMIEKKNSYAMIGSRANYEITVQPSRFISVLCRAICVFIALFLSGQIVCILIGSFENVWAIDRTFTFLHIKNIFSSFSELKNSFLFAFQASIISTSLSLIIAYIEKRTSFFLRSTAGLIAQLPSAIPAILFGLGSVILSTLLDFHFSQFWIVFAMAICFLPYSYKFFSGQLGIISKNLDEASYMCKKGKVKTFFYLLAPLSMRTIIASFLYNFIRGSGTLSAVVFLVSFDTPLISVKILNLIEQGFWGDAAALSSLMILFILLCLVLLLKLMKKRGKAW